MKVLSLLNVWDQLKRHSKSGKVLALLVIASLPICCRGSFARPPGASSIPVPTKATRAAGPVTDRRATETATASAIFATLTDEAPTLAPTTMPSPSPSPTASPSPTVAPPAPTVQAKQLICTVQAGPLNVREGPGTDHGVLFQLSEGETASVIAWGEDNQWAKLRLATGGQGWVAARYIKCRQSAASATRGLKTPEQGRSRQGAPKPEAVVQGGRVNVRRGPDTAYPRVGQVTKKTRLEIVGKNRGGDWWQVCCVNGHRVWIAGWLVQVEGDTDGVPLIPVPPPPPTPTPTATPTEWPSVYMAEPTRPVPVHTPPAPPTQRVCCKICRKGKACGNSCIARWKTCHKPPGCACDAW